MKEIEERIEAAFADRSLLKDAAHTRAIEDAIAALDRGELRVATHEADGEWTVHAWVKRAILLYFAIRGMEKIEIGPFEFHDKIPLKKGLDQAGVRLVPPGAVRRGAFLERGAVVMPGYVNIGAWVVAGS